METGSDGKGGLEAKFSSMKQPPLIKQLQGILSEYPDGGQIIKELLQNAEDAGANEVRILYDGRRINREVDEKKKYRKFFQGPALCVYNDALFTESDWEGIKMIYSSVKENDPLKVGRFGLGFKSVFHITDRPCVISGNHLLLIDPLNKSSNKVNATMDLDKLEQYQKMDIAALLEALGDTFGINRDAIKRGHYPGTVFWFPLRDIASPLSETLYKKSKVMDLFEVFKCEADSILLFLRSLTSVSLNVRETGKTYSEVAKVELVDNVEEIKQKRETFKSVIKDIPTNYTGDPVHSSYTANVRTTVVETATSDCVSGESRWSIVNYFMGGNASKRFRALIKDPSLGYSPYVGIATPLSETRTFIGHVFCILPLPKEGPKLTGLPVHVNGFFALSQNRHHLKWATEEQKGKRVGDKSILWNETLIKEALPLAYDVLIQNLVNHSERVGNTQQAVEKVYDTVPDENKVTLAWKGILPVLFDKLKSQRFLFYRDHESSGKSTWIGVQEACFATLKRPTDDLPHVRDAVVRVLLLLQQRYVAVPDHLFHALVHRYGVNDMSPRRLYDCLRQNQCYRNTTDDDKIAILAYLLSDNDFTKVDGLELLPLASGAWTHFQKTGSPVYICSETETRLFLGLEHVLLKKRSDMPETVSRHFENMCKKGTYQIQKLTPGICKTVITQALDKHLGRDNPKTITTTSALSVEWLSEVWTYIKLHGMVSNFKDVPLVPHLIQGDWARTPEKVQLLRLSETMIVKQDEHEQLPENVCVCMEALAVKVLSSLPDWLPRSEVKEIFLPSPSSVSRLFSRLQSSGDCSHRINNFNNRCDLACRDDLAQFLGDLPEIDGNAKEFIKQLKLFREMDSPSSIPHYISLSRNKVFIHENDFPVQYPRALLIASQSSERVLKRLGASEISCASLVFETLKGIKQGTYETSVMTTFMKYFVTNFQQFSSNCEMSNIAREIPFLKTDGGMKKPSDLFNPNDHILQDLFLGEHRFPEITHASNAMDMIALKCLGLKEQDDVTAEHLIHVGETLDTWARTGAKQEDIQRKAMAFLGYLTRKPSVLGQRIRYPYTLAHELKDLECILLSGDRLQSYPGCLPWYSHPRILCRPTEIRDTSKCLLVGSTMPIVSVQEDVSDLLDLNIDPPVDKVLDQFTFVKENYKVENQTDMLPIVKSIYQYMEKRKCADIQSNFATIRKEVCQKGLIWNGQGFSKPKHVIVKTNPNDIDLQPHFYTIPGEFITFQSLFLSLGCHSEQTMDVLLASLACIARKYHRRHDELSVTKDIKLAVKILNKIAERKDEIEGKFDKILIPIDSDEFDIITMKRANECVYDKDLLDYTPDEGDEPVFIVHEQVSLHTAEALGVRSLNKKALSETEDLGYEAWGQDEPLTSRIHTLLKEGYMDGLSVPKELVQNADDAGATTVKLLYDERTNDDAKVRLLSSGMKECQGPAIWVFNNAEFTREDLINITKLNGATKEKEAKKIGKFGLGFCSVYNLTDVPSFISGSNIVIFDPHMTYLEDALPGNSPGLKIDLCKPKNRSLLKRHSDQFKTYQGIFGCDLYGKELSPFKGTLFRFPLRTFEQSQKSKISAKMYSKQEVQELLSIFINAAGNLLLFTQNIQKIEVFHLPPGASVTEQSLLFSMSRECLMLQSNKILPVTENVLSRISNTKGSFTEIQKRNITLNVTERAKTVLPTIDNELTTTTSSWMISWASGTQESLALSKAGDMYVFPLSAVGIPCSESKTFDPLDLKEMHSGFYKNGHIFCYLPLPLITGLDMHINGSFDVTSDRRHLMSLTEDDKGSHSNQWNEALMTDALVNALVCLLQSLSTKASSSYIYHRLWPTECESVVAPFKRRFFKRIVTENIKVFKGETKWIAFQDVVFLDPQIRECHNIGQAAYDMLQHFSPRFGKTLVEIPSTILLALLESNDNLTEVITQAIIFEEEMLIVFLKNIQDPLWNARKEQRDRMIEHALKCESEHVKSMMTETACIPSEPNGTLRKPGELVHPSCDIAGMFLVSDGRFPVNNKSFRSGPILDKLLGIGMIRTVLPENLLVERCESISKIADVCCDCSLDRCEHILKYVSKIKTPLKDETLVTLKDTHMLPVLARPMNWKFAWVSDRSLALKRFQNTTICDFHPNRIRITVMLGKPAHLYRQLSSDYVGCIESLVDETGYTSTPFSYLMHQPVNVYGLLGVKGNSLNQIPVHRIVKQISLLSDEYHGNGNQFDEIKRIYRHTFDHLVTRLNDDNDDSYLECVKTLHNKPIILIGKELVLPRTVAYNVKEECFPDLNRLPKFEQMGSVKRLYDTIGIRVNFAVSDIVDVLKSKKHKWNFEQCGELDVINNLLLNLEESISKENKVYQDFENDHEFIIGPDKGGVLWPTYELVIDDDDYRTSPNMHILHGRIASELAKGLGVKTKDRKCLEEISYGIPFGQKEKLVTRLKKLLNAYPCDSSIMKELLQNADDAGATEIHFIKDYRTHATPKTLVSGKIQGPALCVFNNSYFRAEDFEGIHNLGEGSKSGDPTKTGQYGVGFNAVYHLTDTPTFLTKGPGLENGGSLCIFDPLCAHIPNVKEHEPGIRYEVDGLRDNFPEVLLGFKEIEGLCSSNTGTIFRLPLRLEHSVISKEEMSIGKVDQILSTLMDDMFEALLFVKKVNCIKISNVTSGQLVEEYAVRVVLSKKDRKIRERFFKEVLEIAASNRIHKVANLTVEPREARYQMKIEDNRGKCKNWFIVQRFGFGPNEKLPEVITEKFKDEELGSLPIGGIAMELSEFCTESKRSDKTAITRQRQAHVHTDGNNTSGKAFCFLPLPIETGLPLHVNGHFALDHESRRELWKDGYRNQWNECLLQYTIAPAFVAALYHLQESLIDTQKRNVTSWPVMYNLMNRYHEMFPLWYNAKSDFWKRAVGLFYKLVLKENIPIFPVVRSSKKAYENQKSKKETTFSISWTALTNSSETYQGVFNDILKHVPEEVQLDAQNKQFRAKNRQNVYVLEDVLKDIGMKLIQTPIDILKTIRKVGIDNVPTANPMFVIQFLKSFEDGPIGGCNIGNVNVNIGHTQFNGVENLRHVIRYIMLENEYHVHIEGLPILLTADFVLRRFSSEAPVYHFKFDRMLPASSSQILHHHFLTILDKQEMYDKGVIRKLGIPEFLTMLPTSHSPDRFARNSNILWNKEANDPLPPEWIQELFEFIYEESFQTPSFRLHYEIGTIPQLDHDKFQTNVQELHQWSFLPSVHQTEVQRKDELIPISKSYCLVNRSIKQNAELASVFDRFCLPSLDISVFDECSYVSKLTYALQKLLASTDKPYELLKCLLHYKERISATNLSCEDGIAVLSFFTRKLTDLQQNEDDSLDEKLRTLPLYATQQGHFVSIEDETDVLVLPDAMPLDGMQDWANATGVTLLKQEDVLKPLYDFLKLSTSSILDVYLNKILPNIQHLPNNCWLNHISFIMDYLLSSYEGYNDKQKRIIIFLKQLRFVEINGAMKRVDELYSHEHPVFVAMLGEMDFPPVAFRKPKWRKLFEELGLKVQPDDPMMIIFASQIERDACNGMTDIVREKSDVIVQHFISKEWKPSTYNVIRTSRFVVPCSVDQEMKHILCQPDDASRLVCFHKSVSFVHRRLCWTSLNLLPDSVLRWMDPKVIQCLGIYDKPPTEKVITHCQNVCEAFKEQLVNEQVSKEFVKSQMEDFYSFFEKHMRESDKFKQRLNQTPFIYIPVENELVLINEVVIELTEEEEVKPYLFKAPTYYGKYYDLFVKIGSERKATCMHYAAILNTLKRKVKDSEMLTPELLTTKKVIANLFRKLNVGQNASLDIGTLYLPDRQRKLVDSKTLTVSNNSHIEKRIGQNVNINFFIGFRKLELIVTDQVREFEKLPEILRPALLTEVVTEHVCIADMIMLEGDRKARLLEEFVHSTELTEGVVRFVKHQFRQSNTDFDETLLASIVSRLQNVKIVKVSGLKTVLKFRENTVQGSEWGKQCFISEETRNEVALYTLYFQERQVVDIMNINDLLEEDGGLIDLIQKCADNLVTPERHLGSILRLIDTPSKIKEKLDMYKIDEYDLPQEFKGSAFPRPGTYVEEKFHPFLEQGIYPFKKHEYKYVALELEDDDMDNDNERGDDVIYSRQSEQHVREPVYIYVHILREEQLPDRSSHLRLQYVIDTGDYNMNSEIVPIYRLYKFVRRNTGEAADVVLYDDEPVGSVAFDENCRRVRQMLREAWELPELEKRRIIRRLLLKWHPDKNHGNEEYCTRIFNYIKEIISKLERGERIEDTVNNDTGRTSPDTSGSSYFGMGCNINRRAKRHARAFRDNLDEYNKSQRSGGYAHQNANRAVRPDHGEAKRWLRQAKNDYRAAEVCLSTVKDVDGYNWICYTCHKACEKAMKAAWFSRDGNCTPRTSHMLTAIAANLTQEMMDQARLLETRLGEHTRMQYPDNASRPRIPSEMFKCEDAVFSINVAKKLIKLADDYIQ